MSRVLKFRAWCPVSKQMSKPLTFGDISRTEGRENWFPKMAFCFDDLVWLEFTGLLDRNGKEIYEGYIVKQGNHQIAEVIFKDGSFSTYIEHGMWLEMSQNSFEFEVIGNVWESPDLLKASP